MINEKTEVTKTEEMINKTFDSELEGKYFNAYRDDVYEERLLFNHTWLTSRKCQIDSNHAEDFPLLLNIEFVFGSKLKLKIENLLFNPILLDDNCTIYDKIKNKFKTNCNVSL